jgi:hypothetical protein
MEKITIKQGEKDLLSIEVKNNNISEEIFDEIEKFNEHDIESYTIKFEESVKLKNAHDISNIKPKFVKEIIVNLK